MQNFLSLFLGYFSIACWFIVGVPQFIEIYRAKSGDGTSILFFAIWLAGDTLNLIGCLLMDEAIQTQLVTALWYVFSDVCLIGIVVYFDYIYKPKRNADSESAPLLKGEHEDEEGDYNSTKKNDAARLMIAIPLVSFMYLGSSCIQTENTADLQFTGRSLQSVVTPDDSHKATMALVGVIVGWACSFLYIISRIPQIYKNYCRKSTDGLSVWMFIFGVIANITYAASIFATSIESSYLIHQLPWLIGSLGTLGFDFTLLGQFYYYRKVEDEELLDDDEKKLLDVQE